MEYRTTLTTCTYCGCGCGLYIETIDGKAVRTLPSKTSPVNEGKLCIKGWYVHEFVQRPDRLTTPLVRKGGALEPASWDEALGLAARELTRIRDTHGADSLGFLTSAKCTNEDNYIFQKLARAVVGTNNVDHCARL